MLFLDFKKSFSKNIFKILNAFGTASNATIKLRIEENKQEIRKSESPVIVKLFSLRHLLYCYYACLFLRVNNVTAAAMSAKIAIPPKIHGLKLSPVLTSIVLLFVIL